MTAASDQLSRIAANDPDPPTMIVKIDAVGGLWLWLCSKHEKARAKKWPVLERRRPVSPVRCQDCHWEKVKEAKKAGAK